MPQSCAPKTVTVASPMCIFTVIKNKVNEALVRPIFLEDSMPN